MGKSRGAGLSLLMGATLAVVTAGSMGLFTVVAQRSAQPPRPTPRAASSPLAEASPIQISPRAERGQSRLRSRGRVAERSVAQSFAEAVVLGTRFSRSDFKSDSDDENDTDETDTDETGPSGAERPDGQPDEADSAPGEDEGSKGSDREHIAGDQDGGSGETGDDSGDASEDTDESEGTGDKFIVTGELSPDSGDDGTDSGDQTDSESGTETETAPTGDSIIGRLTPPSEIRLDPSEGLRVFWRARSSA